MRVQLKASYETEPDKYFWLREAPDGSDVDSLRRRVAAVYSELPPHAFMMIDPALGGEPRGAPAVLEAVPDLAEEIGGIPVRRALSDLADALAMAPLPPRERRTVVHQALDAVDTSRIEQAVSWVAKALDFVFEDSATLKVEVYVVASGVPFGGLTGRRIDDSWICLVAVRGQEGSAFAEALVHEATHVLDAACRSDSSLVARLRSEEGSSHQLWHAPYFIAAAEATRRFIDPQHRDFGETHGYYAKVPNEMTALQARGIIDAIRNS